MQLTINKVAMKLDVTPLTILNWYKWYNNPDFEKPAGMPELPAYQKGEGYYNTKYWEESDLPKLIKFKKWVPKGRGGVMAAWNYRYSKNKDKK